MNEFLAKVKTKLEELAHWFREHWYPKPPPPPVVEMKDPDPVNPKAKKGVRKPPVKRK